MFFFLNSCAINMFLPAYKISRRTKQHDDAADDDGHTNDLIDEPYAVFVELRPYFVHQPRQSPPPEQCPAHNAGKADNHLERMVGQYEGKLGIEGQEEENDERIGERHEKGRPRVVPQRALLHAGVAHLPRGIRAVGVEPEAEQQHGTDYLQIKTVLVVVHEIHDERHAVARKAGIDNVADGCAKSCGKPKPSPFVQCALHTENAYRPHWCRCHHPYEYTLKDEIQYVDWHVKRHNGCKGTKFM